MMSPVPIPAAGGTPPRRRFRAPAAAASALAAAAAMLTGCGAPAPASAQSAGCAPAPSALAIVVAVHADAAPGIPAEAGCLVNAALEADAPISVVAEDGAPYAVLTRHAYGIVPGSDTHDGDLDKARTDLIRTVTTAAARTDGDNALAALALAGQLTARTDGATAGPAWSPAVVVVSPGLPDTGKLDLTVASMATAPAGEVADAVTAAKAVPALPGTRVLWAGLGQAAGAQQPLPAAQAGNYQAIWEAVLAKAGAAAQIIPGPVSGAGTPNSAGHAIRPVPPIAQAPVDLPRAGGTAVYPNTSALGFRPDSTDLRDPAAAATAAAALAAWLTADPHRTLTVTGTTADTGTPQAQHDLALARAQAIAALITARGPDPARITTAGAGHDFPGYTPDHSPDGTLDPARAEANRTVRITLTP
ncbi:hypothetical protein GCM10012320_32880 [Sinomonas cellulolyticus]|uniref:OmpA family protein n=1 Tax=Sinomonas cellulolyticus TaxID=2801916 RepID=A0ABS1JXA3_9MICC|nr:MULTISPECIES: OmpA family protein [Sinomonas]MBL0703981.1 OmpA family protein [Sinomonas cellulolyticus]GHG59014.1 hypothetical protein GCM10012320_32880 [Sinomonas sp. KCTC 49339]